MAGTVRQAVVTAAALFALGSLAVVAVQMQPVDVVRLRPSARAAALPAPVPAEARLARTLGGLHRDLLVRGDLPAAAWERFAISVRAFAECAEDPPPVFPGVSAPERLRALAAHAEARARALDELLPAFQALYGAMSPEQRVAADQLLGREAHRLVRVLRG